MEQPFQNTEPPALVSQSLSILWLMPKLPFPITDGRKSTLSHYIRYLQSNHGAVVTIASFVDDSEALNERPAWMERVLCLEHDGIVRRAVRVLLHSVILGRLPIQTSAFLSSRARRHLRRAVERHQPDVLVVDLIRLGEYHDVVDGPRVFDMADMLSRRYRAQADFTNDDTSPLGRFGEQVPVVDAIVRRLRLGRWLLKLEAHLTGRYEERIVERFDVTTLVSTVEASILGQQTPKGRVVHLPNGVDLSAVSPVPESLRNPGEVVFLGTLSMPHNIDAVRFLIRSIWPLVRRDQPSASLLILGKEPPPWLKSLAEERGDIEVPGYVEDLGGRLAQAQVFLAPLRFGSGVKTKLLEAMAAGVPVVTTAIGAEGIEAIPGVHFLVEEEPEAIARAVVRLLSSREMRASQAEAARAVVAERYDWPVVVKRLYELLMASVRGEDGVT